MRPGPTSRSYSRAFLRPHFMYRSEQWDTRTTIQAGIDILNRPKFFTCSRTSGSVGYDFQTSPTASTTLPSSIRI